MMPEFFVRAPLILATFGGVAMAAPASAAVYSCVFLAECQSPDQPCAQIEPLPVKLIEKNNVWVLHDPEGGMTNFAPVRDDTTGVRTFLATDSDTDASATSILSIFVEDGQAMLSTHGDFVTPAVMTQIGTCKHEVDQ